MTRVFIIAPTPALRAGLRALISTPDLEVIGSASALTEPGSGLQHADVAVIADDQQLGDAQALLTEINALVVMSDDERAISAVQRLPLRGWGIVLAESSAAELQAAILAAARGMIAIPMSLATRLLGQRPPGEVLAEPLTPREQEVLNLLSQGLSNKLIARSLQISEHTVKFHVSSIYTKLGAASRTDAVSRGARRGLITL